MIKAFVDLVRTNAKDSMVVCEVGAWIGNTTKEYLPIIQENNGSSIVVDWFCGNQDMEHMNLPNHIHAYKPYNADLVYEQFLANIHSYINLVTVMRGHSDEVAIHIPNHSLDICFIDADHSYEGVKRNIASYLNKVKPGGILCGHDCENIDLAGHFSEEQLQQHYLYPPFSCHPGVIQAVYDNFGKDIQVIRDDNGDGVPIWVKQL